MTQQQSQQFARLTKLRNYGIISNSEFNKRYHELNKQVWAGK